MIASAVKRRLLTPSSFSLLTSFRIPEQGMHEYEPLSSASLTMLQARRQGRVAANPNRYLFLGPAHVVAPHEFPKYYGDVDWLRFVQAHHIQAHVGAHDENGLLLWKHELRTVARHEALDVVSLELADEESFVREAAANGRELQPTDIDADVDLQSQPLECIGHMQQATVLKPVSVAGEFVREYNGRRFVRTETQLEQGMCGGAVVVRDTPQFVGLVEAIVSRGQGPIGEQLQGCAALIHPDRLREWLARNTNDL
jgi:hypothetical protein